MWSAASTEALLLSMRVCLVATLAVVLAGVPVGLWLARRRTLISRLVESMLSLPLVIPPVVTGYFLLVVLSPRSWLGRWLDAIGLRFPLDWKGAMLASGLMAFPLFLAVAKSAFERCDERLEDAARTLSAGPIKVFCTVTLPIALPGLLAAAGLAFARAFGEFGCTMMLAGSIPGRTQTVPQAIYRHIEMGREQAAMALALVSVAVGIAAMIAAQCLTRPRRVAATQGRADA